jgi:hypothetical protein
VVSLKFRLRLFWTEVIGFGVQQRHERVNHPFKVTAHALEIGQLVVKPGGSQLIGALVGRERHVELVELDERIGQGHSGWPSGLKVVQRVRKGLHGVVSHVEVQVQRPQIHKRRGPGVFVSPFESVLHHLLCELEIVQREQGGIVHLVHGIGLVFFPNAIEVELGLGVAAFVEVEFGQLQIGLGT